MFYLLVITVHPDIEEIRFGRTGINQEIRKVIPGENSEMFFGNLSIQPRCGNNKIAGPKPSVFLYGIDAISITFQKKRERLGSVAFIMYAPFRFLGSENMSLRFGLSFE